MQREIDLELHTETSMSLLNQLFNRSLHGVKCKTCLNLAISRIKLLQNKRSLHLKQIRKEIAQFLQTGQEAIARIRVEHVIREQNIWAAYEILELFCEFVLARVPILETQRECPTDLREAVASIIFAAPRCSDVPDLFQIRNLFAAKYGKEFILAASELRPDTSVNRAIIEKLSVSTPTGEAKLKQLKEIALEYNLDWDSSNTEAELSKRHEDLLDGSKEACGQSATSPAPSQQSPFQCPPSSEPNITLNINNQQEIQAPHSPKTASKKSLSSLDEVEHSIKSYNAGQESDSKIEKRSQSSDILERAQAAIAIAERASAGARTAAELANITSAPWKLEEEKHPKA